MKAIKISIAVVSMLIVATATAQNSAFGIKGGLNLASLSADGNSDKNLIPGFHVGVFDKIALSESFALQPELLYSTKGMKNTYDGFVDGETKFHLNYIDLPVKLVFNLSDDFSLHLGPYISYLVNAKVKTNAEVLNSFDINTEDDIDRKNFNEFDYGFLGGLEFDLDPIIIGASYNLGINPVAPEDEFSRDMLGKAKNNVIQVYVGIKL